MKKKLLYLFALLIAIAISGGSKAQAQNSEKVKAKIPFQFHAAGAAFPAGTYTIRSISSIDDDVMEIQSADGKKAAVIETQQADTNAAKNAHELIFQHIGDDYVLSGIVDADDGTSVELFNPSYLAKHARPLRRTWWSVPQNVRIPFTAR